MWETKNALIWSPNKGFTYGAKRGGEEEEEEEEEEGKTNPRYGCLNLCMEIMDFSMILVQELFGYGLLGFQLDINLVPFSRVLLGKHANSRFKGSLVEKP